MKGWAVSYAHYGKAQTKTETGREPVADAATRYSGSFEADAGAGRGQSGRINAVLARMGKRHTDTIAADSDSSQHSLKILRRTIDAIRSSFVSCYGTK